MNDTISAIATPPGQGGIGVIRISGPESLKIGEAITNRKLKPRQSCYSNFKDRKQEVLDQGIVLFFKGPHSFTGEDVVELQGHGGNVILDCLLQLVLQHGARLANPGEFSQRAFLNGKLDLAQAEAIADLINASSKQAARSAMHSLQGLFSKKINVFLEKLIRLRTQVEALIDFSEEELGLNQHSILIDLEELLNQLGAIQQAAQQGLLLKEGLQVVIAGPPNVGKSSLLNALSQSETAIVSNIPGTTRDILNEGVKIDNFLFYLTDTAGLHETSDVVEKEGIRRAQQAINTADLILLVEDASADLILKEKYQSNALLKVVSSNKPIVFVRNKIDLVDEKAKLRKEKERTEISLSLKTKEGLLLLKNHLKTFVSFNENEGCFIARRRHLEALKDCRSFLEKAINKNNRNNDLELLAEELRQAHNALSQITGKFTTENLLSRVFSSFCLGK